MPSPQPSTSERLWALIRDTRFPILTTRRSDGGLQSRPMIMQNREWQPLDYLWFFTPRDSDQVADLQWDSSVSIIFANSDNLAYVAVFGSASVIEDSARKRLLWSPEAASWFSAGPDDPAMALVRVRIIQADYWDVGRNAVTELFRLHTPPGTAPHPTPDQGSSDATCH